MDKNKTFQYSYSAKEQYEIKNIRQKYAASEKVEDKMEQLRRLDASVTKKATAFSLIVGIFGAIVMGSGMSLVMTEIGKKIGLSSRMAMVVGIAVGLVGIILVSAAYPVYNRITKKERKKIAPEIIRLSDELMK